LLPIRRYTRAALLSLGLFLALIVAIVLGLNKTVDPVVLCAIQRIDSSTALIVAKVLGIIGSIEMTFVAGLVLAGILWSRGYGLAAFAPLAFLATTPVEIFSKYFVPQMLLHPESYRSPFPYPLLSFLAPHPFPSGHAARVAFWLAFGLPLLLSGRRWGLAIGLGIYGVLSLLGRLILGEHWPSDVLGGVLLGIGFGLLAGNAIRASIREVRPLRLTPLLAAVFGQSAKS
jgi:membrane-associated phospholipid phosphatase